MNPAKAKRKHWQFVSVEEHDLQLTSTLHIYSHCVQCVPLRQFPLTIMHRPHAKSEELLTTAPHGVKTPRSQASTHRSQCASTSQYHPLLVILAVFFLTWLGTSICTFLSALQFHSAQICVGLCRHSVGTGTQPSR